MLWTILLGLVFIVGCKLYCDTKKPKGFPPGPRWLPVIGSYLLVRRERLRLGFYHLVWAWLAECYGSVVGLRLGSDLIVLVSGFDAVKEVLAREEFEGRPDGFFFRLRTFGKRLGIVFTDGQFWLDQRRFCLRHLRHFGFGKRDMDSSIETEAMELIASLRSKCSVSSVQMNDAFDICVVNSLWTMIAGQRFAQDDARLLELMDIVHTSFRMLDMTGGILNQMPYLRHIAPRRSGFVKLMSVLQRMWNFLSETIADHETTFTVDHSRDLIDSFLCVMKSKVGDEQSDYTLDQLLSLCLDLFMAGSETTSNTLSFAVLYTLLHPAVQARAQAELDLAVGRDRQPTYRDRTRLCYVEAVLMEVQRITNIAPVGIAHRATTSTTLQGHIIPEGSTVLVSLWSLHMDTAHWGDPHVFRPERFLDANGNLRHDDWFMPFGFGRRRCLGEILAKTNLFVFFAAILHNFNLSLPDGHPEPTTVGYDGVTISAKPFHAKLTPRA